MRYKALVYAMSATLLAGSAATAFADDGQILRRQISSPPGLEVDPEPEGEHAFISMMGFLVPTQRANGTLEPVEYYNIDDVLVKTEDKAKPLISVYVYGPVIGFDDFSQSGFPGHGRRDAFGAVSLDDGETWKVTNLSNSADLNVFPLTTDFLVPDPSDPDCHHAPADETVSVQQSAVQLVQQAGGGQGGGTGNSASPEIEDAEWDAEDGELDVEGETGRRGRVEVSIINAATGEEVCTTRSDRDGEFECEVDIESDEEVPCSVVAVVGNAESEAVDVEDAPENCDDGTGGEGECTLLSEYPGDVTNIFHSTAGNRVLVAWQSRYCDSGFPGYTGGNISDAETLAGYLGIDNTVDLYLTDLFGVAGSQGSVDYREQEEFPGEYDGVGEVPFNCLWSARGVLRPDPVNVGATELVWFQAERLTSGRRDVNRIEVSCVAGGGCGISWQEDPDGLRPGEGEGAGTGWAGATTNSQTDIWYSFVEWEDFDIVDPESIDTSADPIPLANNLLNTGRPKPYVPMMVPVRLTNNARCQTNAALGDYCNSDTDLAYGLVDQCVGTIQIPLGPQGNLQDICVVDANKSGTLDAGDLPNVANTAASRPRLNLRPRDTDGDGITDDAWVIIIHEEDKGLGRYGFLNDELYTDETTVATACADPDASQDDNCVRADIGKNQFYISFALGTPQTSLVDGTAAADVDYSMLNSLVAQQNMYNAPEVNWITGTFYPPMSTADMWNFADANGADLNFSIVNTEIARRASLMSQPLGKALATAEATGQDEVIMAMPLFKEGIINQGGPADIMARRIAITVEGDRCESWSPGPGPQGVQPFLDEAIGTCNVEDDGKLSDCEIAVTGEVCVDPEMDFGPRGTRIILNLYSGGDQNVELCDDFIDIRVTESTTFEGVCALEDDLVNEDYGLPCSVKVVTGPGTTAGQGQASDPIDVEYADDLPECVDY